MKPSEPMEDARKTSGESSLLKQALLALQQMQAKLDAAERRNTEPIAIVGLGCRFPGGAVDGESFWDLLHDGRDAISVVPPDRWDADAYYDPDPDKPGKTITRWGGFLDRADGFDAKFFEIAPREAASMDPQQRLALEVAWEALENAGIAPTNLHGTKTGVFLGIASRDYSQLVSRDGDPERMDGHYGLGVSQSVASGRISYILGLRGPSISIDTACSSSLVAVHLACQGLRSGDCTLALAGGVNLMLSPETTASLSRLKMLSPGGNCKAFDESADGFVRGEGCGFVALKRLSEALADVDRIVAVIRGTAINQDGASSSLTAPNGPSQVDLMRQALANGGVSPGQVSYIEAHGTGTPLGDPIELQALGAVYGAARPAEKPLLVGSLKTNIGHLEASAGIAGLIKTVLALQHRQIPAHLHLKRPTPHVRWEELRLAVPRKLTDWGEGLAATGNARIAAVSSFGYSGTNGHVVVEEGPRNAPVRDASVWPVQVLAVSAKSATALHRLAGNYREYLDRHPDAGLDDFCFTANAGRSHFSHRACLLAPDVRTMQEQLAGFAPAAGVHGREAQRLGFLFTGQGSQYAGMGRELYESSAVFRSAIERCAAAWKRETGESLTEVLYPPTGEPNQLEQARYAQPALYAVEYALAEMWRSWGVEPSVLLGHSLGEYVAAAVAGVFSVEDGMRLVCARARLMDTLREPGAMRAVSAPAERVRKAIAGHEKEVSIAAVNGAESVVISGHAERVAEISRGLEAEGIRTRALQVTHAFHSPLLEPILDEFERVAAQVEYRSPKIRIVSNFTGKAARADEMAKPRYWREHMRNTVQFAAGLKAALDTGCRTFIEIGPQPHLMALGKSAHSDPDTSWLPSIRKGRDPWADLLTAVRALYLQGVDIDWKALHGKAGLRLALPTYPFERERHWFQSKSKSAAKGHGLPEDDWIASSFYDVAWTPVQPKTAPEIRFNGACVLAGDTAAVQRLSASLGQRGIHHATLPTDKVATDSGMGYEANFLRINGEGLASISDLFYIAPRETVETVPLTSDAIMDAERNSLRECLRIAQALLRMEREQTPRLWILTWNAQGPAATNVAQSPLWGFGRAVAAEHPEMRVMRIDLDAASEFDPEAVLRSLPLATAEEELALRGAQIYAPRLLRLGPNAEGASGTNAPRRSNSRAIREDGAYLVTGGLSGIGAAVVEWLAGRGAAHVIAMGRSAPDAKALETFAKLRESGTDISIFRGDVGNEADVLAAFGLAEKVPLRGIFHCAGTFDDGALLQQDWERFERVLAPKLQGTWNLHRLSADRPIEHFVLFSSVASVFGSPGQTNYSAANAFLDAVAQLRHAQGLPALSVDWGAWSETGAALRKGMLARQAKIGMEGISTRNALDALERAMAGERAQVVVARVDWKRYFFNAAPGADRAFLRELQSREMPSQGAGTDRDSPSRPEKTSWLPQLRSAMPAQRLKLLLALLEERVQSTLGIDGAQPIDPEQPLHELGLDSLLSIELRNSLSASLERPLPATLLFNYPTLESLARFLSREIFGGGEEGVRMRVTEFAPTELVDDVEAMSDEEVDRLLTARAMGDAK